MKVQAAKNIQEVEVLDSKNKPIGKMKETEVRNSFNLQEGEVLKFKNIALQRQLYNSELEKLIYQEELLAQQVSIRVGTNVARWQYDLKNGVVIRPEKT